jgi:molybdopterin converting factor small subunit
MKIRAVITGRFYHATSSLPNVLTLADGASVDDALAELSRHLPVDQSLPESCLVAVSGRHVGTLSAHESVPLREGDELVLVAPVAGG